MTSDINQNQFVHMENEVHRPAGLWTKNVHKLLRALRENGFYSAPEPLGFDEEGREVVTFLKGQTIDTPLAPNAKSIGVLTSAAKLLRAYHNASQNFLKDDSRTHQDWMLPSKNPQEVICHGDFAPYNVVFDGDQAVGIIDFDAAHPGPRAWDIAYALYRFAPFTNPDNEDGFGSIEDQISRARLFCDIYGLAKENRSELAALMIERLEALLNFLIKSAQEGNRKFEQNIKEGHHLKYIADIEYVKSHKLAIQEGLIRLDSNNKKRNFIK